MQRLDFPEVTDVNIAFGGYPQDWFSETLKLPEDSKYSKAASKLFFNGGSIDINESLPEDYKNRGIRLFKAIFGSFKPKHEHKEHVCGLILKSLCDP